MATTGRSGFLLLRRCASGTETPKHVSVLAFLLSVSWTATGDGAKTALRRRSRTSAQWKLMAKCLVKKRDLKKRRRHVPMTNESDKYCVRMNRTSNI